MWNNSIFTEDNKNSYALYKNSNKVICIDFDSLERVWIHRSGRNMGSENSFLTSLVYFEPKMRNKKNSFSFSLFPFTTLFYAIIFPLSGCYS